MKVNIVVITLSTRGTEFISQWGIPFTSKSEANKYAEKLRAYWRKTNLAIKVTVQNSMPIRMKVGKDWRKAGV